jgi:hypothetical protein
MTVPTAQASPGDVAETEESVADPGGLGLGTTRQPDELVLAGLHGGDAAAGASTPARSTGTARPCTAVTRVR